MNLLDRHIFKSVLFTSAVAVGLFAFVLILGNAIKDLLGYLLQGQITAPTFAWLVVLLIPFVISYALPLGVLTGVLLTLGRLSADSEVTAMRAAGLSLARIARPVFIFGFLGMLAGLYVNFNSMPWARVEFHRQLTEAVRARPLNFIVPKTFISQFPGVVIYVGEKNGTELRDFWLWKLDRERRVQQLVRADSGSFDFDVSTNELILTLNHAQAEERDEKFPENFVESQRMASFDKYGPERLSLERIFGRGTGATIKLAWMTYPQLQAERARIAAEPVPPAQARQHARDEMKVQLTVHDKINTALAILSFALIGVPLGIKVSRRETSANLGVAVILALGYYLLNVMVGWLDRHPEYRPDLLLWVPNLIFIGLGLWLFARIERR
ncbi:MAG TPA: LptF/LptG family permease [Opitutaceae bacterium]|nr:LptF/LptG family permease [Opitutaceae bacterium]